MNPSLQLDLKKLKAEYKQNPLPYVPLNLFRLRVANLVAQYTTELQTDYKQLKFRTMKSRWGSCSEHKVLSFNTKLKLLPQSLVELVVFHECLHLIYLNHGAEFKLAMAAKFVDYKQRNYLLKLYGLMKI
ncbi:M48 family metallopeptidase [bacterium]|nr:MAG: M48 family metallopeptidase [bacterium]